jgi:hypothetical protein
LVASAAAVLGMIIVSPGNAERVFEPVEPE